MTAADAAFRDWTAHSLTQVEVALSDWVPLSAPAGLGEAMRYAVLDGGKRLRPLLTLAAARAGQIEARMAPKSVNPIANP